MQILAHIKPTGLGLLDFVDLDDKLMEIQSGVFSRENSQPCSLGGPEDRRTEELSSGNTCITFISLTTAAF